VTREPLVHFLMIGAALFLLFEWGGGGGEERRIVIPRGQVEHLAQSFELVWLRPPTGEELEGLVGDYVREEVAVREAIAMGLDRDDTVIRRRLRQKLEFLFEDNIDVHPPTDEDLQLWLENHPESFRSEPRISFRQVYVSRDRRGENADSFAREILEDLTRTGGDASRASLDALGDPLMLPRDVSLSPRSEVARIFGEDFAATLLALDPGRWTGPIESGYGLHLVWVTERAEGRLPALAEVRDQVERELLTGRRKAELDLAYERLLSRYKVEVEKEASIP
jgi:PPIC-type PPIASE domain